MDSKLSRLFIVIAIGGWVVQSVLKKRRRDAARAAVEVYDGHDVDESIAEDDEEFVPAVSAYADDHDDWDEAPHVTDTPMPAPARPSSPSHTPDADRGPADEPADDTGRRGVPLFAGRSLRDAVIMSEVLRRPKGLR